MTWAAIANYIAAHGARTRGRRDHRSRHLAHHQAAAHLLARHAACGFSLPGGLLPGAALLRRAAANLLRRLHALRLVALVARRARRRAKCASCRFRCRNAIAGIGRGRCRQLSAGRAGRRMHAALPHLDAALTSYSLVASWWQARKHIANWWLWIVVDTHLHRRVHLQGSLAHGRALCRACGARRPRPARLAPRRGKSAPVPSPVFAGP